MLNNLIERYPSLSGCKTELESAKRRIKILRQDADGEIELADVPEGTFREEN